MKPPKTQKPSKRRKPEADEEEDEAEPAKKRRKFALKLPGFLKRKKAKAEDDEDEREKDREDEEEEEGKPAKKRRKFALKLPGFLKRKKAKAEDDEEEEREEGRDDEEEEEGKPAKKRRKFALKLPAFLTRKKAKADDEKEPEEPAEDAEDEEGEEGEGRGKDRERKKRLVLIAASAGVLLFGIAGGLGWWLLAGDSGAKKTATPPPAQADKTKGPSASIILPPKPGSLNTLVAPAPGPRPAARPLATGPTVPTRPSSPGTPQPARPTGADLAGKAGEVGGAFGGAVDPLGGALNAVGGQVDQSAGIVVPSVTSTTVARLPDQPRVEPLSGTPDARLIEEKKKDQPAPLPKIGKDGTMAWQLYARPNKITEGPRVAILIMDIGLSRAASIAAVTKLPPEMTMVLDPYGKDLSDWVVRSRLAGHEVMLAMPMESDRFPIQDAGPLSLDSSLSTEDNLKRLELLLAQVTGYTGVVTKMGSRFATSEALLTPVIDALNGRGLMLAATGPQRTVATPKVAAKVGIPRVLSDITLDDDPSRLAIEEKLNQVDELVRQRQTVVVVAHPYPSTVERLINWTKSLKDKKIALVPVSALAIKQKAE